MLFFKKMLFINKYWPSIIQPLLSKQNNSINHKKINGWTGKQKKKKYSPNIEVVLSF